MKLFKITFFFVILSFSSFAKDSTSVGFKRFVIGIYASPDYCFRTLTNNDGSSNSADIINFREEIEIPMLSYTAGADLSYFIKKQFAISLGVNFSQKGYKTKSFTLTDINGSSLGATQFRYNYNYIEVPVKAIFVFGKNKIRFLASAGVTSAFLLYQQTISKTEDYNGTKESKKGKPNYIYNPFNLFLNGSAGVDFKLGTKIGLKIEPTYSYGLFQTIDAPITEYLWSAGLNVGFYIGF